VIDFFPINTATSCQLKWTWSTIYLYTGETNSCHKVLASPIDAHNFDSFHNTEKKLQDRKLMLAGNWPSGGCEYCQRIEAAGGVSDRMFQSQIPNLSPPELSHDPHAINVTPRILEIYLDNVCNMSCIYCDSKYSSRIEQENIKFGHFTHGSLEIKNTSSKHPEFEKLSRELWNWLDKNYHVLRRLHVLGGEPFYQSQFETCLAFLENHKNSELEFNVVSNLKVPLPKLQSFVERIKSLIRSRRIARLDMTCSIDCWGPEQEYIRHGMNIEQWQKNFDYLAAQKWIKLNINQTLTSLGMKTIKHLLQYVNQHRQHRKIEHYFQSCLRNPHLETKIFGPGYFDKDFGEILSFMPGLTWQDQHARKLMEGIWLETNSGTRNNQQLGNLRAFLDEIDRRRGSNWKETFPWLQKELDHVV